MSWALNELLEKVIGNFICVYEGESKAFSSKDEFEKSDIEKNCSVLSIGTWDGMIILELKRLNPPVADTDSDWAKEYERQFGTTPSFF